MKKDVIAQKAPEPTSAPAPAISHLAEDIINPYDVCPVDQEIMDRDLEAELDRVLQPVLHGTDGFEATQPQIHSALGCYVKKAELEANRKGLSLAAAEVFLTYVDDEGRMYDADLCLGSRCTIDE